MSVFVSSCSEIPAVPLALSYPMSFASGMNLLPDGSMWDKLAAGRDLSFDPCDMHIGSVGTVCASGWLGGASIHCPLWLIGVNGHPFS